MRTILIPTVAAACLCTATLLSPPALASGCQTIERNTSVRTTATTKQKPVETKPAATKPVSTTTVAVATKKKEPKDRPGKRFWGRIMDHFREIHSADKKMK